ncbi:MAG: RNA polymerase sigma-70 factor (ECF subfamily) [Saprospiraceae bacterium]|jgi:RNA polymerase sigma-70 factor (ECF subfamily)
MNSISISTIFTRNEKSLEKTNSATSLTEENIASDAHILALLQQHGNYDQGFRLLVQQYRERLYYHVRRMVGNHEDADDILQNCFVKVYRNIHRFKQNSKLYTWLYRIATNEALTFLEKRNRIATASLDNEDINWNNRLKAESFVNEDKAIKILERAIETLPDKQKAVFNLRYYDEMSYADMSEALETSQGALKASYHHAVKKVEAYVRANAEK